MYDETEEDFKYLMDTVYQFQKDNDDLIIGCDISIVHRKLPFTMKMDVFDVATFPIKLRNPRNGIKANEYQYNQIHEGEAVLFVPLPLTMVEVDSVFAWVNQIMVSEVKPYTLKVLVDLKQRHFGVALVTF